MNKDYPLDMICQACPHGRRAFNRSTGAFTILEVLVGVVLAAGVVSVLVPGLMRQMALGEQSNRLTAVEAAVSSDLDWFNNYARIWKMKTGSYPDNKATSTPFSLITKASSYTSAGSATYDPTSANCASGLADALLADGRSLYLIPGLSSLRSANLYKAFFPPNEIKSAPSTTTIAVTSGGVTVSDLNVIRSVETVGNRIRLTYTIQRGKVDDARTDGLNFVREASLFVEAAAWCDRLS
jgi:type II secretory pathway pseudopilin PulG